MQTISTRTGQQSVALPASMKQQEGHKMTNFEKEILDYVREHPGCNRSDIGAAIGNLEAEYEADRTVRDGKLDRWYTGQVPAYYIPGTYAPPHLREPEMRELIPLAAGLHHDGTIHIYVNEEDSGLSVGLLEDGTLIVKIKAEQSA